MMSECNDSYRTIDRGGEAVYRQLGSRFLSFAYYVTSEDEIKERVDALRKKYYDATHCCFAWRLGAKGERYRAADDCEPSGTAGKPILGQLLSADLTDSLVAVVRYFGGTKLGVSGLISAYRQSASDAIVASTVVERTVNVTVEVCFGFEVMNDVMRVVKEFTPRIVEQQFDNTCKMRLEIRAGKSEAMNAKLSKIEGLTLTTI